MDAYFFDVRLIQERDKKKKFLNSSIRAIKKYYPEYDEEKLEIIEYGLESLYLSITKLIIIFGLSYYLGILLEVFLLSLSYNLIRFTALGMHASKSIHCLIISLIYTSLFFYD